MEAGKQKAVSRMQRSRRQGSMELLNAVKAEKRKTESSGIIRGKFDKFLLVENWGENNGGKKASFYWAVMLAKRGGIKENII